MSKDYYQILGVAKTANADEIKKAYRGLALQWHPDRKPEEEKAEAGEKFKEIAEAYGILSDSQKRAEYDQFGSDRVRVGSGFNPFDIFNHINFGNFNDFFGQRPRQGKHIETELLVTLDDVANGGAKRITYVRHDCCESCKGVGGTGSTCSTCRGHGRVSHQPNFMSTVITGCQTCRGSGTVVTQTCSSCAGRGIIESQRTLDINIPIGINEGAVLRAQGEGEKSDCSLPRGDLHCVIRIQEHSVFKRKQNDLFAPCNISYMQACLGGTVTVETIYHEQIQLNIPAGSKDGDILKIANKGLQGIDPSGRKVTGHHLAVLKISVPTYLSEKSKSILRDFEKSLTN